MAIGDELVAGSQRMVPTSFTPEMEQAGVQLIPSGGTTPVGPERDLFPGIAPGVERFEDLQNMLRMESDRMRAPIFAPEDIRPANPFNPTQLQIPEDDALTPPGMMAPSEVKETGNFFAKLGDILANPGAQKFLASLGMAITPSKSDPLGALGIDLAESNAQRMFQQRLQAGEAAGDILIPGLSTAGRQEVLGNFRAQQAQRAEQERLRAAGEREDRLLDIRSRSLEEVEIPREQRLQEAADARALAQAGEAVQANADPNQVFNQGASALGINVPEGLDLSQFTPDQAFDLVQELASIRRTTLATQDKPSDDGVPELSEAMRRVSIKSLGARLQQARAALTAAGGSTDRAVALRLINDLSDQILELGGDPSQFVEGANVSFGPDPGIAKIMEISGLSEQEAQALSIPEKTAFLQSWLRQQSQ